MFRRERSIKKKTHPETSSSSLIFSGSVKRLLDYRPATTRLCPKGRRVNDRAFSRGHHVSFLEDRKTKSRCRIRESERNSPGQWNDILPEDNICHRDRKDPHRTSPLPQFPDQFVAPPPFEATRNC